MFAWLFLRLLNWEASAPENSPERVIKSLAVQEGQTIADIGAGGGYFTLEFAGQVGNTGKVYAVDIKLRYLDFIKRQSKKRGLDNIVFVLATGDEMKLPEAGLDLVFARNVFHHLHESAKYFQNLKRFLKPTGKVAIIEQKPKGRFSFVGMFKHYTSFDVILREMEKVGYFLDGSFDFLPQQTFTLFKAK